MRHFKSHKIAARCLTSGFSLIELLLVIAIIGIISTFSTSFYSRFIMQNAAFNTGDQLVGDFRRAQILAMMGRQNSNWGVNITGATLTLYMGNNYASRNTDFDEEFSLNPNISISGMSDVNFARITGLPSTTPNITISGSGSTQNISINAQGVAIR